MHKINFIFGNFCHIACPSFILKKKWIKSNLIRIICFIPASFAICLISSGVFSYLCKFSSSAFFILGMN